jgi:hypothetical protein
MPHPNQPVVVRHPEANVMVALDPAVDYPADDILVSAFPGFFAEVTASSEVIESVRIEAATAAPGEKRTRSRAK